MRIGINCLSIDPKYRGGVNSFTWGLISGLISINASHDIQIYCSERNYKEFERLKGVPRFEVIRLDGYSSFFNRLTRRLVLWIGSKELYRLVTNLIFRKYSKMMSKNSDFIYFPTVSLIPFNYEAPTMVSMHDIQQRHYPDFFSRIELRDRKITYNLTAEYSHFMQASSTHMKEDFLEYFQCLKEEQIFKVSEGVDLKIFFKKDIPSSEILHKYGLPERFLFFPGQLWHHKNHITVLKALSYLNDELGLEVPLVMTGEKFSASEHLFNFIEEKKMNSFVFYLGKVPFADLVSLYRVSTFLITAVLYESSSLPILEAAACGVPIIASSTPPNIEMSKNLNINLFSPLDSTGLAKLIQKVWQDPAISERQSATNLKAIQSYSWNNVARKYLEFFESKAEEKKYAIAR